MYNQWHTFREGKVEGPFSWDQLKQKAENQELKCVDYVWNPGYTDWQRVEALPELQALPASTQPPTPPGLFSPSVPSCEEMSTQTGSGARLKVNKSGPSALPKRPIRLSPLRKIKLALYILIMGLLLFWGVTLYSSYQLSKDYEEDPLFAEFRAELTALAEMKQANDSPLVPALAVEEDANDEKALEGGEEINPTEPAIAVYIGMSDRDIVARFGEPEDKGFWKGAEYYDYIYSQDLMFYFNQGLPGEVTGLSYTGEDFVLGTKVGMTGKEIRAVLGPPDYEGYDHGYSPPIYSYFYTIENLAGSALNVTADLNLVFNTYSPDEPVNYIDITGN